MEKELLQNEKKNFGIFLYFCYNSFLLFCSYLSCTNMISEIYNQLGYTSLGNWTVFSSYFGILVSGIIFPAFFKILSFKFWYVLAGFGFCIFQFGCLLTFLCSQNSSNLCVQNIIYPMNIILGLIGGISNGITWISQTGYITSLSNSQNKGLYFSLYTAFFMLSYTASGLLTALTIAISQSQYYFFIACLIIECLASFLFFFLADSPMTAFMSSIDNNKKLQTIKKVLALFWTKISERESFLSFFNGTEIGIYCSFFYTVIEKTLKIEDDIDTNVKTAYIFICFGVFDVIGGVFSSWFADRYNKNILLFLVFLSFGIAFIIINIIFYWNPNYFLCFVLGACMGFGDCLIQSLINIIISMKENNIESFSHYISIVGSACILSIAFSIILSEEMYIMYLWIVYLCVSIFLLKKD